MSDNYTEEIQPLYKLLKNEAAFRFVIVQHNHFSLVRRLQEDLKQKYPTKKFTRLDAEKTNIQEILTTYDALGSGFLFLENFEDSLKESTNSVGKETTELASINSRRQHITRGLNLRRDRLTKSPIALILFISTTAGKLYAKNLMEKMPDLWSFRSWILELEATQIVPEINVSRSIETVEKNDSTLGGIDRPAKLAELNRLLTNLQEVDKEEIALRKTLYPQVIDLLKEVGQYQNALMYLEEWAELEAEAQQANILFDKGDIYGIVGDLVAAKKAFEEALGIYKKIENKNYIGLCYERLGDTYKDLGELNEALVFFEKYQKIEKELVEQFPEVATYKNNLAISYSKLGETQSSLGDLDKALEYFEEYSRLKKELYRSYPENVSFKNGLAISYSKLGETQSSLGDLDKALEYFVERFRLAKELYRSYSENVSFKNGLAISYSKLGETQSRLGNLEKALEYFEKSSRLAKELYTSYPENVSFKNDLAILYLKLGEMQSRLGNLEKALEYFEELYSSYPENVRFKNGLAVSYWKLGDFYRTQKDKIKARHNFEKCHKLLLELQKSVPNYKLFQDNLAKIRDYLKNL